MIKVLGTATADNQKHNCNTFLLNSSILIDAGNSPLLPTAQNNEIEHVFLTHSHFDHICALPFMIDSRFQSSTKPLKIYGLKSTLDDLKTHLFNDTLWPEFQKILHRDTQQPMLSFIEIEFDEIVQIDDLEITPIEAVHTIPCCGFLIKKNGLGTVISGDTHYNPKLVELINQDHCIQSMLIETSFPSHVNELADITQHLTPSSLKQIVDEIKRPINVYSYHLKPTYESDIIEELNQPEFSNLVTQVLETDDEINSFSDNVTITESNLLQPSDDTQKLNALISIAQALSAETDLDRLFEMIVEQAMNLANADAGTLYQLSADKKELIFRVVQNQSLNIHMGGTAEPVTWDNLALHQADGTFNLQMVAAVAAITKQVINIDDVYQFTDFNFDGTRKFDKNTGYRSTSMLVVPLLDRNKELIGVLQLINKLDRNGKPIPFRDPDPANTLALGSQAAIALNNVLLTQELETLFESVIKTISKALDEKCSMSGNHVRQVSELSMVIAKAIHTDQDTYQHINYSHDDFSTIKMASLLHDIGKVSTPEFILNKSTKLEKVYDRIDAIQERIEILKRDAKIDYLEQKLEKASSDKPVDSEKLDCEYHARIQYLDEVYQHLARINIGGESLHDDDLSLIQELSKISYNRQGQETDLLQDDEILHLSIRAGTLTYAERDKIKDHARVSLEILQSLPFPKKYQRVPDIAANHHERLNGSGYPRGLTERQLTLEDRILILADIYEALSSQDRTYKKPYKLSQIYAILHEMSDKGFIDKKLLDFFFESGTYKQYNRFLNAQQIDELPIG